VKENKMSKKAKVIAHFKEYPTATPKDVATLFGAAVSNVYNYRKEALGVSKKPRKGKAKTWTEIAIEASHVSTPRTPDYPWTGLGLYMDRNAVRGFLKGHMLLLLQGLDDRNFEARMQEMSAVLDKLKSMKD
jgi:hypothetical protein